MLFYVPDIIIPLLFPGREYVILGSGCSIWLPTLFAMNELNKIEIGCDTKVAVDIRDIMRTIAAITIPELEETVPFTALHRF